jgi:RNA polymerase sigma factor (sigma-70 family)
MRSSEAPAPLWPAELARLQPQLRLAGGQPRREHARAAFWCLLVQVLERFLRGYARRANASWDDEVQDLASEKALGLLLRAESGAWDLSGRHPGEIVRYLSHAARNGWLDHVTATRRESSRGDLPGDVEAMEEWMDVGPLPSERASAPSAEASVEASELAAALRDCVTQLPERDRRVWFYRAFYEMSSKDIAEHPRIGLRTDHVDVINQRAREGLRRCMGSKGHDLTEFPKEAFVRLWEVLEDMAREGEGNMPAMREPQDPGVPS